MSTLQIDFGHAEPRIVGIDLGTTNSLIAVMEPTGPRILSGIVPSVVSVTPAGGGGVGAGAREGGPSVVSGAPAGEVVVGAEGREMLITHPERSVYSVKRLMGRDAADIQ